MKLNEMNEKLSNELNEFNQPSNSKNPTDMAPVQPKRYNAATGKQTAMKTKSQRITRKSQMDLVNSKDLGTLMGQIDVSFKQILSAADNTGSIETFIIQQLNMTKQRIAKRVEQEKKKNK